MNIALYSLIVILICHWIGDFVFQWDELALKKGVSMAWLGIHVLIYGAVISLASLLVLPARTAFAFGMVNMALHFVTDLGTSRLARKYKDVPRKFFLIIGFDQMVHTITLIITLNSFYIYPT